MIYTHIRSTKEAKDKLDKLAKRNSQSMIQQLDKLLNEALEKVK